MKFKKIFGAIICLFCLLFSSGFSYVNESAIKDENCKILAFGDSISAGYVPNSSNNQEMLKKYNNYVNGTTDINLNCFTNYFAKKISETYKNVDVESFAKSGDKSSDLVQILSREDIKSKIKLANAITLCIGANNIFGPALDKMQDYLIEKINDEDLKKIFDEGVNNFTSDYKNKILPTFLATDAKIYVMTIYNPYKYFSKSDIQNPNNISLLDSVMQKFQNMLNIAMQYIAKINDFIKSNTSGKIIVVDIHQTFEKFSKTEYSTYLNVDSSKIVVNNIMDITNIPSSVYVDPHPTETGQEKIAETFYENLNKVNTSNNTPNNKANIIIYVILCCFGGFAIILSIYFIIRKIKYRKLV